ncbi:sulfotransferase [Sulfuritalea sp.]|uniref:sulfotransferase family protein n=1 Tax=Sulfuritalea sp. TaxID=2480090 RepID=UPI00286DA579|nr:sulfotransferase [Sulfuritalea sp.]
MTCKPLFVFGLARSGTNLLARMLDRHPDVTVALDPYLPLFRSLRNALVASRAAEEVRRRFSPSAPFQDYYFDSDGPALLDLMLAGQADLPLDQDELQALRLKTGERASLESPTLGAQMAGLAGKDYGQLFRSGLDLVAGLKTGVRWAGCKEVWVLEFVPLLARLFPEARFFALERDPRAIVASLLAMAEKDPTQAAHAPSYLRHWRKQVALTHRFAADPLLAGRFRSISFERLATRPEDEARQLCDALDVDFHPEMLRLSADGWKGNSSFDHGGKDIYAETVDRWRKVLPARVVQAADYLCGPEMALTPYRPITSPKANEVLAYLEEAGRETGSWRSDSGDLLVDFGGEMIRHMLLDTGSEPDESLVRRCFLFNGILGSLRQCGA